MTRANNGSTGNAVRASAPAFLILCTLAVNLMQGSNNAVPAVLADFADFYSVDFTQVSMLQTIVFLTALPMNLVANTLINRLGLKNCCIIAPLGATILGVLPAVVSLPFTALVVVRALFGAFYGLSIPLGLTAATKYFADENLRGTVIGWGMTATNILNIVLSMGSAFLAAGGLNRMWWVHLVFAIPAILAFLMPDPDTAAAADEAPASAAGEDAPAASAEPQGDMRIPALAWFFAFMYVAANFFSSAFSINISSVVQGEGIGTAANSALMISIMSVAGMLVGLVFGKLYQMLGKAFPIVTFALYAIAFAGFSFSSSLVLLYVCSFVTGLAYIGTVTWASTCISISAPPSKTAFVFGLANALVFLLMFTYNFIIAGIAVPFGMSGSARFPFYVSLIAFAALAVVNAIRAFTASTSAPAASAE